MYFDKETDFNFLTLKNNGKIVAFSSQTKGCLAINTLNDERKVNYNYNLEYLAFRKFYSSIYYL
jgi:hypothetical protein